jgi:alpha/beta superfamily hydrolase
VSGARLRTVATHADAPRALVLGSRASHCESIEHPLDRDAPLASFTADLTRAGFSTLRFDKRGVGDSDGGPCAEN